MVDVACTDEVLEALAPEISAEDCKPYSWQEFGRFGYFRSQRYTYDRRVGGGNDVNEEFYANHHQVWKATVDAEGNRIPVRRERMLRPVVYYLNLGFSEDLMETTAKIGDDWNNAFMEMAIAATGRSAETIAGCGPMRTQRRYSQRPTRMALVASFRSEKTTARYAVSTPT